MDHLDEGRLTWGWGESSQGGEGSIQHVESELAPVSLSLGPDSLFLLLRDYCLLRIISLVI